MLRFRVRPPSGRRTTAWAFVATAACISVPSGPAPTATTAPRAGDAPQADVDPHDQVRRFAKTMYTGRLWRSGYRTVKHENLEVVYKYRVSRSDRPAIESFISGLHLRQMEVGDSVPQPDGSLLTLTEEHVNETRHVYRFCHPGTTIPMGEVFTAVKIDGKWHVDPAWQIEARMRDRTAPRTATSHSLKEKRDEG